MRWGKITNEATLDRKEDQDEVLGHSKTLSLVLFNNIAVYKCKNIKDNRC